MVELVVLLPKLVLLPITVVYEVEVVYEVLAYVLLYVYPTRTIWRAVLLLVDVPLNLLVELSWAEVVAFAQVLPVQFPL